MGKASHSMLYGGWEMGNEGWGIPLGSRMEMVYWEIGISNREDGVINHLYLKDISVEGSGDIKF